MRFASTCRSAARFAAAALVAVCAGAVQATEVAQTAPELDIRLLNGKVLKAKDLRGKVVVSVIWATWSPAARMNLREVQKFYQAHRDKGLEVVALSIDENAADVREFWRKRDYSFPVAIRSDEFFERYGRASTTPMFYIVDRQGVLRHRVAGTLGPEQLDELLQPLLAEQPTAPRVAKQ